jgi:GntR family transcriptional regulator / MocR family aminotransferase
VLADFFAEGHFERHLRAMRLVYQGRHDAFLAGLERELGDLILPPEAGTGLHTLVTLRAALPIDELTASATKVGVGIYPARPYYLRPPEHASLLMGYTGLDEGAIEEGLRRLGRVARGLASRLGKSEADARGPPAAAGCDVRNPLGWR